MENAAVNTVEYWQNQWEEKDKIIEALKQQILLMKQGRFCSKSEKLKIEGQLFLFNEAEECADPEIPEPEIEIITYNRKKEKGNVRKTYRACLLNR